MAVYFSVQKDFIAQTGDPTEGLDTLEEINEAYVDNNHRPYINIRINHTCIIDDPFDDPPHLAELIPNDSPERRNPKDKEIEDVVLWLEDDWVPMDEQLSAAELEKVLVAK
ncbi:Peptidyl-prolyl cis-trans isomerase [Thalictrum thalictroides]|uniref:Peptidyl-prolyl cis-trans isomerase n=1 Tax=Thalictrum thalictroides TaxID=46969 RepID=A0A7J6VU60_THATH|nr:Peptidyl-prolyl cis-trans isomerase [Thalictrum thalictroides]